MQAIHIPENRLFVWRGVIYVRGEDVCSDGSFDYIIVREVATYWTHEKEWVSSGETHRFNPYCEVEPLQVIGVPEIQIVP